MRVGRTIRWCGSLLVAMLAVGCDVDRDQLEESQEKLRNEEEEARKEVGREVEEGREEVAEAERNLVEALKERERAGELVRFEGVVSTVDPDSVVVRLENGETFEVDYGPQARFLRGGDAIRAVELSPGTGVVVSYRYGDGKRMVEEIRVREEAQPGAEGTQPRTNGAQPSPTGEQPQPGTPSEPGTR